MSDPLPPVDNRATPSPTSQESVDDRRVHPRRVYETLVGLVLVDDAGGRGDPMVLRSRDLSTGGMGLVGRHPIDAGTAGVMQIVRGDGRVALLGVVIRHCRYVDDQTHEIGLEFCDLPPGVTAADFMDEHGTIELFDPLLKDAGND